MRSDFAGDNRKQRQANIKRGPGVFVYDGSAMDSASRPTFKRNGRLVAVLDDDGFPVTDTSGNQVHEQSGSFVKDRSGARILGGVPEVTMTPMDVFKMKSRNGRPLDFPVGKEVVVSDVDIAFRLRMLDCFSETGESSDGGDATATIEAQSGRIAELEAELRAARLPESLPGPSRKKAKKQVSKKQG